MDIRLLLKVAEFLPQSDSCSTLLLLLHEKIILCGIYDIESFCSIIFIDVLLFLKIPDMLAKLHICFILFSEYCVIKYFHVRLVNIDLATNSKLKSSTSC